jgi:hypothetical protein
MPVTVVSNKRRESFVSSSVFKPWDLRYRPLLHLSVIHCVDYFLGTLRICVFTLVKKLSKLGVPFLNFRCRTGSGSHPASYLVGTGALSRGVKRPAREANHSSPSGAEVKNA